jgi:hypothetical protein
MAELQEVEVDGQIIAFDGRVLEIFEGMLQTQVRCHVKQMKLQLEGPDKKGSYRVIVTTPKGSTFQLRLDEADLSSAKPILDAVIAGTQ